MNYVCVNFGSFEEYGYGYGNDLDLLIMSHHFVSLFTS